MKHPTVTQQVSKKTKRGSKALSRIMIVFICLFMFLGIAFADARGFFMFAFIFAALYFAYGREKVKDYEYVFEDGFLRIYTIKGKVKKKLSHELDINELEVVAPHYHEAVSKYKKKGGSERLPKFDYTSYDPNVLYYTMIITENERKIKLLLDMNYEMLDVMKRMFPQKVFMS